MVYLIRLKLASMARNRQRYQDQSRRKLLRAIGITTTAAIAGCLGSDEQAPEAVSLDDGQTCDECGMVINEHPGPTGQVFFAEDRLDRDGPAWFCSGTCTYSYRFDREDEGWEPLVTYLTDYSRVEYDIRGESDRSISPHLNTDSYRPESTLVVVAGSDVGGAMGPDIIPFSDTEEASTFADEYSGTVVDAVDIDRELIDGIRS